MTKILNNFEFIASKCTNILSSGEEQLLFGRLVTARKVITKLEKKHKRTRIESSQLGIARNQWKQMRQRIVTANIALVLSLTKKYFIINVTNEELINEGLVKLLQCIDKFDPKRGFKFSTYATKAIFHCFIRAGSVEEKHFSGRIDTEETDYWNIPICMDDREPTDNLLCLRQALTKNTAGLNNMEIFVLQEQYGAKPKTIYEIGLMTALTKGRIQQISAEAVRKLRLVLKE